MYYSIQFSASFLIMLFFCATCVQVYDFPFMHGFQAIPLKFVKVQTNTSLLLRETKVFEFVLKPIVEYHTRNIHDSTQFCA
jgi:hypothetical protein